MSFVLLYLASLLSSTPQLHFPFALFVLSLCTFFSHSCFILSLPLQWACSLNHIRDGGFATSHPLHWNSAAALSVSFYSFFFLVVVVVVVVGGGVSPLIPFFHLTFFLTLTQPPYTIHHTHYFSIHLLFIQLAHLHNTIHFNFLFSLLSHLAVLGIIAPLSCLK